MIFLWSKDFLKMSGLPSSRPSPSLRGSILRRRGNHFHSWFWSPGRPVQWISASKVLCEMNVYCAVLFICTIYSHSECSRQVSLLQKSSQLVLQSVTGNVLINGDFLT